MQGALGHAGPAAGSTGSERPASLRVVGLLLAAVAALYVIAPAMNAAVVPLVASELGLGPHHEAVARVVGQTLAIVTLVAVGRTGDVRGRRCVLLVSLVVLCAGCLLLAVAFNPWSYVLGRVVMAAALAAVFVSCLAFMATVSMPGRIRRMMGGWLAAMSAGFVIAVNVAPRAASVAGWRLIMAGMTLAAVGAMLLARRYLPRGGPSESYRLPDPVRTGCRVAAAALGAAGLQLAPLWGWSDPRVGALLVAAATALAVARLRARRQTARASGVAPLSGPVWTAALIAGIALGFTQVVLAMAVPALTGAAGGSAEGGALVLSAFGLGGMVSCLLVRHRGIAPLTGASLGLPLAALGLALLHTALDSGTYRLAAGYAVVALVGFGIMLAMAPQMARFLSVIPRTHLGVNAALLPAAILFGTAAAQAMPYTSALNGAPTHAEARELLWIGTIVVAVAALALGRPVVALVVAAASGLQYLLVDTHISKSVTVVIALTVGAAAGTVAWSRREQAERLSRTRETASALQHAVLHPIPTDLGALRLAGLYRPATTESGIGGDFLEAVDTPYGTRILIGDVRGKGLQAVQTVTDLLGCFRSQAHETPELGEVAARLDRQVQRVAVARGDDELFATALLLQHKGPARELEVVNCGHLAPLAVSPTRAGEVEGPALLPLGLGALDAAGPVRTHPVVLDPGTTLVVHTDGLSEARNSSGEFYPIAERLTDIARSAPHELVRHLDGDVRDWTHRLTDDIAVIALGHRPRPSDLVTAR
ncbi:SpoIIE family protein phosphatase [Streptomyces sp. NPDC048629]|uniref:SpoIIE family protein phosphatase n=1 Tax=Streptomyces sp. NPDC048629 TaxID=3154824 RepID=UPI0034271D0B